ncbi:hypothetical protein Angca_008014, partial [Angiostrongylus cantonensis]
MAGDLEDLERDLANGLEMTAKVLQERYVELQPLLKMPEDDIVVELEDLLKKVDEKLQLAGSFMRENSEMDSSTQKSGLTVIAHDRNLRRKLHDLSNQRQLLDTVQHIEGLLISCRSLSLSKIDKARSLIECENLLNEITKDDGPAILTGKIRDILREEVITMIDILKASLTYAFNEFVSYPTIDVKGTIHMRIRNSDPAVIQEVLVALHLFDELNGRLKKWASFIVKNFVQPIVDSGSGVDPYERFDFANGASEFVGSTKIKPSVNPICLEGIELNNRPLTLCLGNLLQEDVMMSFLKCITNAYPLTDPDESTLKAAMDIAERFREDMMKMHFFNDATPTFKEFSNEHFTMFIDRRCLEVLKKAKELITMPYLMLAEVGIGEEVDEETVLQYRELFGKLSESTTNVSDSTYPVLLQLPRCKVSQSTVDLMELMFTVLQDALKTDNEKLCGRLTLTVRNVLQLFTLTASRHHGTAISSMPNMAAIFYNNCYYICHRLMLMPFSLLRNVDKNSAKYASFRPILSDSLWKIREIGADVLEQTMAQCRRDINVMLAKENLFGGIDDLERYDAAKNVLNACLMHIQNVSNHLKDVLPEMVYSCTLGNVVSFLLDSISDVILRTEDIRSVDADISSTMIETLLTELIPVFTIKGQSSIHKSCSTAYFRMKEIIFCLKGSLQGIDDRWCSGKGPLAQWLKANEVRSLVKAL